MLEPGRIISSETSSGSTPGGINRTVRANRALSEIEGLAALEAERFRPSGGGWGAAECESGVLKERERGPGEVFGERAAEKTAARGRFCRRLFSIIAILAGETAVATEASKKFPNA